MHMTEQRHAGDGAKQHADQYWYECQQYAQPSKRQQQQQHDTQRGTTADPGDFPRGLALAVGGVQQAAGGQQLGIGRLRLGAS
ncbi:hypothetical protein D3C80_1524600 [compost metagenome]